MNHAHDPSHQAMTAPVGSVAENEPRPSLSELVAARMSPASLLGLDDDEFDAVSDYERHVSEERAKLAAGITDALDGADQATIALNELVSASVFDVEYDGQPGDDLRAHLETAARELRAASRIADQAARR
ncbi:hypothetical protein ACFV9C_42705 [Kribbella sp. NPDC059898]|uniref:hypothetical protein n=1 Tax=Kribbella sp. NPDC059898 TaxID=3346995 RepID=UPI003652C252